MKLYLDTTNNTQVTIRLDDKEFIHQVASPRDQDVFGFLISCFEKENLTPQDITEIEVNPGPGSFTGTRIGVTIANALSFSLKVPVNGQTKSIEPVYSSPPSITTAQVKDL